MNRVRLILRCILFGLSLAACDNPDETARSSLVPGLEPTDTARIFAPGIISAGDASCPTFTPDGRTVFFMREAGGDYTVLISAWGGEAWSEPEIAPFSGTYADIDPFVTPDGSAVLFASRRPLVAGGSESSEFQLWSAPLDGTAVGAAAPFGPARDESASRFFATLTSDGTAYFSQRAVGGSTGNDIYQSTRVQGAYTDPVPVTSLNTEHSDSNPYVTPDGDMIVFFSARPGGLGNSDLYVAFREESRWTEPRNLGPLVNSPAFENCPAITPDGRFLLFARGFRNESGEVVERNIFYISADTVFRRQN